VERQVLQDQVGHREVVVVQVQVVPRVLQEHQVLQVLVGLQELRVLQEHQVLQVLVVLQELPVHQEHQVRQRFIKQHQVLHLH
jgi:hypothetical protein